jgi:hypothetical protein
MTDAALDRGAERGGPDARVHRQRGERRDLLVLLAADVLAPLALFYGLRAVGISTWIALVVGVAGPLSRLTLQAVADRRVSQPPILSVTLIVCGTAIGAISGDARVLLARESYITAVAGLWIMSTLLAGRPFLFDATVRFMPAADAAAWEAAWRGEPRFRRLLRLMTAAWGGAFLADSLARVVMAYTLPVDVVPAASVGLLVALLTAVVWLSRRYARLRLASPSPPNRLTAPSRAERGSAADASRRIEQPNET